MDTRTRLSASCRDIEQNLISESQSHPSGIPQENHSSETLPPYEPHADLTTEATDNNTPDRKAVDSKKSSSVLRPPESTADSMSSQPKPKSKSGPSFMKNIMQSYDERKKAREAAKKVDYYEKNYGFVPKNVMTEAEWKKARKDAPKVEGSNQLKATAYHGHYW